MLRNRIIKLGILKSTFILTALCTFASLAIYLLIILPSNALRPAGLLVSFIAPVLIAPAVCFTLLRTVFALHQAREELLQARGELEKRSADGLKTAEALQESRERHRILSEASHEGIALTEKGSLIDVNDQLADMLGYTRSELVGREVLGLIAPESRDPVAEAQRTGRLDAYEHCLLKKDGTVITVESRARALRVGGRTLRITALRDISERKNIEANLEMTQYYVDKASIGIWRMGMDARIQSVNTYACQSLGYTRDELCRMSVLDIDPAFSQEVWEQSIHDLRLNGSTTFESIHRRKDGTTFSVEIMTNYFVFHGEEFSIAFVQDISERKQREEENARLQDQLFKAQKLESIGTLAGGIAHDFNNILSGIQGYISLMQRAADADESPRERLQKIEQQVRKGANLTRQLLGFAQHGKYEVRPTNLNLVLNESADIFGQMKREIAIARDLQDDVWIVSVDRGQIEQVLMNLYINAGHAMPEGGELLLSTRNVILSEDDLRTFPVRPGRYVMVSVTDSGIGMDSKTLEQIFDPFFTTKEPGKGTGLGLASAYGIVKNHEGYITATSVSGQGATLTIYLPASAQAFVPEEKPVTPELFPGQETILLVDDERSNICVTRELLEGLGYRVIPAGSGQEAVATYMEMREKIDLVILDLIMPGMSGRKAYEMLRDVNPGIKVILSSGYGVEGEVRKILALGCNGFIQKPFHITDLSKKIREILLSPQSPLPGAAPGGGGSEDQNPPPTFSSF